MPLREKKVEHVFTGMEIDESLDLHIKSWKIQPIAWAVIGLFVLAGLLGLFGTGLLSNVTRQSGSVKVKYERFFRFGAPMTMEVIDETGLPETEISFPSHYLRRFNVQSIVPDPTDTEISGEQIKYKFKAGYPGRQVFFYLEPQQPGNASGTLSVNNRQIHLSQFIFP